MVQTLILLWRHKHGEDLSPLNNIELLMNLQIGKLHWHLGMHWNAFESAPSLSEIKVEADHFSANQYALRVSDLATQVGFSYELASSSKEGGKTYSLAARLANAVAEPWFGIFHLEDDRYWYIAVRDGYSILPDGDLVGTLDEIDRVRDTHASFKDWTKVEGDRETLEALLATIAQQESSGATPKSKLVRVNFLSTKARLPWKWFLIGACIFSLLGATLLWQKFHNEQVAQRAARAAQIAAAKNLANQALAPLAQPTANTWLEACKVPLFALPLSQFAWQLVQVSCVGSEALAQWKLAPGATVKNRPYGILNDDDTAVTQTMALQFATNGQSAQTQTLAPGTLDQNVLSLRFIAQSTGMSLEFHHFAQAPVPVLPGQAYQAINSDEQVTNTVSIPTPLKNNAFVLISKVAPFTIDFSSVPGMRINKLSTNLLDDVGYKIEGMVYGY